MGGVRVGMGGVRVGMMEEEGWGWGRKVGEQIQLQL